MVTARFEGGKLVEARLHPADLGIEHRTTSKAGNPTTPTPEIARRILEKVQAISKPFGTTIAIENGVGVIRVTLASINQAGGWLVVQPERVEDDAG